MNTIYIKFPISTTQYEERYMLGIEFDWSQSLQDKIDADSAFTAKTTTPSYMSATTLTYEGTLHGDVTIKGDSRDTIFAPLVTSKLHFNLVSHNFPSWMMEATQYYTSVRCVLCARIKNEWAEAWRGYIWGNTLNSTVVDDWITTSIYALDELSMAKYIKVGNTIGDYGKSRRLWSYFAFYKSFNDANFGLIYTLMGSNSTDQIFWDDNLCLMDGSGNPLPDLLSELWLDSYMYVNFDKEEEMKTWSDLFSDVCELLGVTFCVGGYSWPKDSYLITTVNPENINKVYNKYTHDNEYYTGVTSSTTSNFLTITPSEKVDAVFNITLKPQEWKGAKFTSEAKRYKAHEYLNDDNLDYYNENKYCLERWGTSGEGSSIATYCIAKPMYHKLYYMKPTTKENKYISAHTQNIDLTYTAGSDQPFENLAYLIHYNYISANTQAQNYDYPRTADTLDYLITKRGGSIVKLGTFERRDVCEDEDLDNYLIMANHKWYQAYHFPLFHSDIAINDGDALMGNDFAYFDFKPWGNNQIRHTNEDYYLQIDYTMLALDENKGVIDFPTSASPYHRTYIGNTQIDAFPCTDAGIDYGDEDNTSWNCIVGSYYNGENIQGFAPMIQLRATMGDRYLSNRGHWYPMDQISHYPAGYNMMNYPDGMDTCVYAINAMTDDSFGYKFTAPYNDLHPRNDGGKERFLLNVGGYGGAGAPIDGLVNIQFWGPAVCYDFTDNAHSYRNNIYYLIKGLEFKFTDMAEIEGKDMVLETMDVYDTLSKTKKIREKSFNLCSPKYSGLFYNCFTFSNNKEIRNAVNYYQQSNQLVSDCAEFYVLRNYTQYDWPNLMTVDLKMRYHAEDNYYHSQILISGLTECPNEVFVVKEKTFNVTRNVVEFKADRFLMNESNKETSEGAGDKVQINDYEDTGIEGDQINRDDTIIDEQE